MEGRVTWEGRTPPPWLVADGMTSAETSPGRWPPLPMVPALLVTPRMLPVVAARTQHDTSAPGWHSRALNVSKSDRRRQHRAAHQLQSAAALPTACRRTQCRVLLLTQCMLLQAQCRHVAREGLAADPHGTSPLLLTYADILESGYQVAHCSSLYFCQGAAMSYNELPASDSVLSTET